MWLPILRAAASGRPYISGKIMTKFKESALEQYAIFMREDRDELGICLVQ
jgi:hypothetical protein